MSTTHLRIPVLVTATIGAALALAACSSGGSGGDHPATGATTVPATSAGTSGNTVTATETEFHIALSTKALKAGAITFHVKNAGSVTHALTVDGPGVSDKSTGDISPGSSATLTVIVKAGSYQVFCPVGNHKMEGMDETVKVS
ncbi:MAG: hypothetical protein ACR2LF_13635 [Jatrophihabitantaceae bacterium]